MVLLFSAEAHSRFAAEAAILPDSVCVMQAMPPCVLAQNLSGPGLDADVTLPPLATLQAHDTFELDFSLGCPGSRDVDCPIWDHTVQLFVCCDDPSPHAPPCEPCDPTLWSSSSSSVGTALGNTAWTTSHNQAGLLFGPSPRGRSSSSISRSSSSRCGRELGRWLTPFRSAALLHC